jgi:hypothetical protein
MDTRDDVDDVDDVFEQIEAAEMRLLQHGVHGEKERLAQSDVPPNSEEEKKARWEKIHGQCALGRPSGRCLRDDEIMTLANIHGVTEKGKSATQVLSELMHAEGCQSEICLMDALSKKMEGTAYEQIVKRIRMVAMQTPGPEDIDALLDNFLLIRLGKQIEANYKDVKFAGVLTYDFMIPPTTSVYGEPSKVWDSFQKDKWKRLQFILNIDHRMGRGIHWVSMIVDAEMKELQYSDSTGLPPLDGLLRSSAVFPGITDERGRYLSLITQWITDVCGIFTARGHPLRLIYNDTKHQLPSDRSGCGTYAVLALMVSAERRPFDKFNSQPISRDQIRGVRQKLFRRNGSTIFQPARLQ